ncbi:trimeric LpxA-like protein [Lojkania enalia]|uniref:Trimeric LpxA-like protein n=1 Tax=Lojkania enalia TaxID=147567 RepID=A0A9P4N8V1_9PLEO|nr:trimeric LpxA-like protein [Didymosphaeria enalia]
MPSVVQTQLINNNVGFMLKEKATEPIVSAFTAVNGRTSPPSLPRTNGINGMTTEPLHVRPLSRNNTELNRDPRGQQPGRDDWTPAPRVLENGLQNGHHSSVSPPLHGSDGSPSSPKRKRSGSIEDGRAVHSPDSAIAHHRRRLDAYAPVARDDSPNTLSQAQSAPMDTQQRLPPIDRPEHERNWPPRESHEAGHNNYPSPEYRDPRGMDNGQDGTNQTSPSGTQVNGPVDSQTPTERSSTIEITRAGVQVESAKKRKRQFANRTKTGCGTCRRRKKKCDEAKPECNNCLRGGFICEGYANKIPWPKNGISKPHPPLQAKDGRFSVDPAQLYHSHGATREGYPDRAAHPSTDGGRAQPIVVEEHDRARNGWGQSWGEHPRPYQPEHHPPSEYAPPNGLPHPRPTSNEQHIPLPTQGAVPQRQHTPRIYHHTQATMSHVINTSPAVPAEAQGHHQPQHHQPPQVHPAVSTGPPGPPPGHYAPPPPPKPQRSEKDKMLSGELFMPYTASLTEDRQRCKGLCFRFNNTSNFQVEIAKEERERHFRAILSANWTRHPRNPEQLAGSVGSEVFVDTPFNCDYGYNIHIGDRVAIGTNCKLLDSGRITIGRNCTIGANVTIDTLRIPTDHKSYKGTHGTSVAAEVNIGDNVWIGPNTIITAGVKIGTGAIIHPGSVVVRDVPRDVIVKGPAAEVRAVHWNDD